MSWISAIVALRRIPALADRVVALEAQAAECSRTTSRVVDLESSFDDVEAVARELYTGTPAKDRP
jgi:hypothetical protein